MGEKEKSFNSNTSSSKCSRKLFASIVIAGIVGCLLGCLWTWLAMRYSSSGENQPAKTAPKSRPNFVMFLADDTGYGDFRSFGHPVQEWTGVDRMVKEGKQFTQFYSIAIICTPSRAAILTGRYPVRSGIYGNGMNPVFTPVSSGGLPKSELTIAEALKQGDYVTGMTGKWHLGVNKDNSTDGYYLPTNQGFDQAKAMIPVTHHWACEQGAPYSMMQATQCFLYDNDQIIEQPVNLGNLTSRTVTDAKTFITDHKDDSFFLFISFAQSHAAIFSDPRFARKSKRGPYGDFINEMGWAIDEVLDHLIELGIDKDTFALFLSDHGAAISGCPDDGSNGPFRGGKFTTWEGGLRIPAVAWWPGVVEPNTVSNTIITTLDILPTYLSLADLNRTVSDITVDGISFERELTSSHAQSSAFNDRPLFFYCNALLTAVRYKKYKIHYYAGNHSADGFNNENYKKCQYDLGLDILQYRRGFDCYENFVKQDPPLIFDVEADCEEHISINPETSRHQQIMAEVSPLVEKHSSSIEIAESEIDKPSRNELQPCCNPPACKCNYGH